MKVKSLFKPTREAQRRANAKVVKAALRQAKHDLGAIKPKMLKALNPGDEDRLARARAALNDAIEGFWSEVGQ